MKTWRIAQLATLLTVMASHGATVTFSPDMPSIGMHQPVTAKFDVPVDPGDVGIGCSALCNGRPMQVLFIASWNAERTAVVITPERGFWPGSSVELGVLGSAYQFYVLPLTISIDWNTLVLNGLTLDKQTTVLLSYDCTSWEPWRTFKATNVTHTLHDLPLNRMVFFKVRQD